METECMNFKEKYMSGEMSEQEVYEAFRKECDKEMLRNNKYMTNKYFEKWEENIIKMFFNDMKEGKFPTAGKPTIKCHSCSFRNVACFPDGDTVGCYGGWNFDEDWV